jgi:hypothetical protein
MDPGRTGSQHERWNTIMKSLKIKSLELFKVSPRWLFLKMTTEEGLYGWGDRSWRVGRIWWLQP